MRHGSQGREPWPTLALGGKRIRNKQPGNRGVGGWVASSEIQNKPNSHWRPMVKTLSFHCGFDLRETKISEGMWCDKKKKKKKKLASAPHSRGQR